MQSHCNFLCVNWISLMRSVFHSYELCSLWKLTIFLAQILQPTYVKRNSLSVKHIYLWLTTIKYKIYVCMYVCERMYLFVCIWWSVTSTCHKSIVRGYIFFPFSKNKFKAIFLFRVHRCRFFFLLCMRSCCKYTNTLTYILIYKYL